jgi:glucose-1-phosphate thymidylyltransferase
MNVIILAAGYSVRLYPLTLTLAKPLICVGEKTILDRIMDKVEVLSNISKIIIVVNAKFYPQFDNWLQRYTIAHPKSAPISLLNDGTISNETRLGAVGDLVLALDKSGFDEDTLIMAGDNLFEGSLFEFCKNSNERDASLLGVHEFSSPDEVQNKFGIVSADPAGRVQAFHEKPENPTTTLAATAIYLIRQSGLPLIPILYKEPHEKEQNAGEIIQFLLTKGEPVFVHNFPVWFDIGGPEDLDKAVSHCRIRDKIIQK